MLPGNVCIIKMIFNIWVEMGLRRGKAKNGVVMWEHLSCSSTSPSSQDLPKFPSFTGLYKWNQHGRPLPSPHCSFFVRDTLWDFPVPHILKTPQLTAWRVRMWRVTNLRRQRVTRKRKFPLGSPKQPMSKLLL